VLGLPVETPQSLRATDAQATFSAYAPDVAVVAAYGLILPQAVLDIPALGCLNIHASLLPRWRGAAPILPNTWPPQAWRPWPSGSKASKTTLTW